MPDVGVFTRSDLGTPTTVYTYQIASGEPSFYICRWEPKTFRPAQMRGDRIFWNLNDVPNLLYRFPDVFAAIEDGKDIWIVDGEKDADALSGAGVVATCCARAQGWTREHSEELTGARRVKIVADRDGGRGLEQANEVLNSLVADAGIPLDNIIIVQAAVGKDSYDHLQAGKTLEEFEVVEEEVDGIKFVDLDSIAISDPEWLMEGYIPAGELTILQGHGGCNKGTFAAQLASLVTKGYGDCQYGESAPVLWASAEDALATILKPRLIAAGAVTGLVLPFTVRRDGINGTLSLPEDIAALREAVERTGAMLVVIDPILSHLSGKVDSHRDHDVKRALRPLAQMANETGCSVLGIHHLGKDTSRGALLSGMGSAAFGNTARIVLAMAEHDEREDIRVLEVVKTNISKRGLRKSLRVDLVNVPGLSDVVPRTVDAGDAEKSVDEMSVAKTKRGPQKASAKTLILRALKDGPQPWDHLKTVCFAEGIDSESAWMAVNALKLDGNVLSESGGFGTSKTWRLSEVEEVKGLVKF